MYGRTDVPRRVSRRSSKDVSQTRRSSIKFHRNRIWFKIAMRLTSFCNLRVSDAAPHLSDSCYVEETGQLSRNKLQTVGVATSATLRSVSVAHFQQVGVSLRMKLCNTFSPITLQLATTQQCIERHATNRNMSAVDQRRHNERRKSGKSSKTRCESALVMRRLDCTNENESRAQPRHAE